MKDDLKKRFAVFVEEKHLFTVKTPVLLAVSGGPDSVVMCELFAAGGFPFGVAHCNFGLRGNESEGDERFVRELAQKYGASFHFIRFDTQNYAAEKKLSIQAAARELRYDWLEKVRMENDYTFMATAHHQNDVAETMLYNLAKGTGIAGLHGILPKNGKVIRPLLFAHKEEILQFAKQNNLAFRIDASNEQTKYSRNKIRHEVMPALRQINPQLERSMYENAQRFAEVEHIYREGIERYRKKLLLKNEKEYAYGDLLIPIRKLKTVKPIRSVLYELLKPFGFKTSGIGQILEALDAEPGKIFLSPSHQIIKDRRFLIISERNAKATDYTLVFEGKTKVGKPDMSLHFELGDAENLQISHSPDVAYLNAEKLKFPLMLRHRRRADYFYPFGMGMKKKKLSRFFIDIKLSITDKDRVWILADDEKRIAWVVGHRIDERFKINESTKKVLIVKKKPV